MGDDVKRVLIIAEAGVNHNGSLELAKRLADAAKQAGADVVKYQMFKADKIASRFADKARYQQDACGSGETQREMLRKLELDDESFLSLKEYCQEIGIRFWATSFDTESTSFLVNKMGISTLKVPSGEINDYPYLTDVAHYGLPVILSCGMSSVDEVSDALNLLKEEGAGEITLLHCNTQYPTPYSDVNLRAMVSLGQLFDVKVGYSDHTPGIEVPIAAVALGATVIEKHFTLDKTLPGPDHKASLNPEELRIMVSSIRNIEEALGKSEKTITPSERENRLVARKSIVASRDIVKGEMFSDANITTKRPGGGINPMRWPEVIGQRAKRDFASDEVIEL